MLEGIKVVEYATYMAAPGAGSILRDWGADVVKIEPPGGDPIRLFFKTIGTDITDNPVFDFDNRGKKSIVVDTSKPEGQELVRKLVADADVFLTNVRPGGLERSGLDYDSLKRINPKLIYCSITGFGQDGPYANRPGYDFLIQAMGGLMSITGQPDGEPGAGPMKVGVALTDIMTGLYATIGVLAALSHRDRTGEGQYVEAALLDVQVACLANQAMNYLTTGQAPGRMGNAHPNIVPYQDFPTADGNMVLTVGNDEQFTRLCDVLEHPEWASDERFATNRARVANRTELIPRLRQATVMRSTQEWVQILERSGVPCGPVNTLDQVFEDPQVLARGMKQSVQHPSLGDVPTVGNPIRLKLTPVSYRTAPPLLGEQSKQVLEKIAGLSSGEIESLRERGIVS